MFINDVRVNNLRVEYRVNPLGVDNANPRFSWNMVAQERGQRQKAYQILIATSSEMLTATTVDVWDSGRVSSDQSVAINYEGDPLSASTTYYWKVIVWDKNNNPVHSANDNYFETGLKSDDGVLGWDEARWITMANRESNSVGAPMFRKVIHLARKVKSARLYVSALGAYKIYLNGETLKILDQDGNVTQELLTPGWTNFDRTINYMTYDVTNYLHDNNYIVMRAVLGNGWFNSRISSGSRYYSEVGNDLALLLKLSITYDDHSTEVIVTDTDSGWKSTDSGPFRENDIYDGETYDATKEMGDWDTEVFDDSKWNRIKEHDFKKRFPDVKILSYNGVTARIINELAQCPQTTKLYKGIIPTEDTKNGKGKINILESRETKARQLPITIHSSETASFDFGQNMVGIPKITVKGPAGTQIKLRFGEMLNDDSEGADGPEGSIYFANLRSAKQTCLYTLKGDESGETYETSFSFFGFRYIELTVLTHHSVIEVLNLTGQVTSSLTNLLGRIETSSDDVNRLFSNIIWGHRGNYFWVPTDCPQRDERLGWTGDTQLFATTALYNGDCNLFLENFMKTLVDSQTIYGYDEASFTSTSPGNQFANFNSFEWSGKGPKGQSGWADIGVILPWSIWQMTGDKTVIESNYDAMVKYMDWQYSQTEETYKGPGSIGDWLGFQGTGNQFMSDVYYAYDAKLMSAMAEATGHGNDRRKYDKLFEHIKRSFVERYIGVDQNGQLIVRSSYIEDENDVFENGIAVYRSIKEDNTQTALLWCLKLGLYQSENQKQQMIQILTQNIKNQASYKTDHPTSTRMNFAEYTLSVGFLGVNVLGPILSDIGHSDLAYALLLQDKMPSWLYSVKNGATTIWERWNSYSKSDGFGNVGMNSFNHYSYGAIAEWMFKYMAGISNDEDAPGFKHFVLQPTIDSNRSISKVKASYQSVYGTIKSEWEVKGDRFIYEIAIPANTSATVYIPTQSQIDILLNTKPLTTAQGTNLVSFANGRAVLELESGSYIIQSKV